jgi:hypothetical protein
MDLGGCVGTALRLLFISASRRNSSENAKIPIQLVQNLVST